LRFDEIKRTLGPFASPLCLSAIVVFLILPLFVNDYIKHFFIMIFFFAFLGLAWDICGGYAGLFSIGHAGFLGVGAYTSTILLTKAGISPWVGMLAGASIAIVLGLALGFVSFRYGLIGSFFALATIAFGEIIRIAADNMEVLNKSKGILIPFKGNSLLDMQFNSKLPYYYIIFGFLVVMMITSRLLQRSRIGYCLYAIRENEDATNALGINPMRYKLIAIAVSAFFTALGGTFYAQYVMYIQPDSVLSIPMSVEIITRPIIGGMGSVLGPILGSFLIGTLSELTRTLLAGFGKAGVHLIIYGLLIILVVIFIPSGLLPWMEGLWMRIRNPRSERAGERRGSA
jgi:branched-chain amino acid transport system permease protein